MNTATETETKIVLSGHECVDIIKQLQSMDTLLKMFDAEIQSLFYYDCEDQKCGFDKARQTFQTNMYRMKRINTINEDLSNVFEQKLLFRTATSSTPTSLSQIFRTPISTRKKEIKPTGIKSSSLSVESDSDLTKRQKILIASDDDTVCQSYVDNDDDAVDDDNDEYEIYMQKDQEQENHEDDQEENDETDETETNETSINSKKRKRPLLVTGPTVMQSPSKIIDSAQKSKLTHQKAWEYRFNGLCSYQNDNVGSYPTVATDKSLYMWICRQREAYRHEQYLTTHPEQRDKVFLTQKRRISRKQIAKLNGILFDWAPEFPVRQWERQFQSLLSFVRRQQKQLVWELNAAREYQPLDFAAARRVELPAKLAQWVFMEPDEIKSGYRNTPFWKNRLKRLQQLGVTIKKSGACSWSLPTELMVDPDDVEIAT